MFGVQLCNTLDGCLQALFCLLLSKSGVLNGLAYVDLMCLFIVIFKSRAKGRWGDKGVSNPLFVGELNSIALGGGGNFNGTKSGFSLGLNLD